MPQYNHHLQRRRNDRPNGSYEKYQTIDNVIQQARSSAPSATELALAMGLEAAFCAGASTLPELVVHLNAAAVAAPSGQPWGEQSLVAFLEQHGEAA